MPKKTEESGKILTAKQETFLLSYITAPTLRSAAQAAGVHEDTARGWLKLPHVRTAYQEMRERHLDEGLSILISLTRAAATTLGKNLRDDAPPGVQVGAARTILQLAMDVYKTDVLAAEIDELKEMLKGVGNG